MAQAGQVTLRRLAAVAHKHVRFVVASARSTTFCLLHLTQKHIRAFNYDCSCSSNNSSSSSNTSFTRRKCAASRAKALALAMVGQRRSRRIRQGRARGVSPPFSSYNGTSNNSSNAHARHCRRLLVRWLAFLCVAVLTFAILRPTTTPNVAQQQLQRRQQPQQRQQQLKQQQRQQ